MRKATLATLLMLLTALSAGCEPRGNNDAQSSRPVHCTVVADGPKKMDNANRIASRVRFRCGTPGAQKLSLKITIEKSDGENWHSVTTQSFNLSGKDTYAPELKYQSREASVGCATGSFRTVVDWSRTSRGDTEGDNLVSGAVRNPCQPKIFSTEAEK